MATINNIIKRLFDIAVTACMLPVIFPLLLMGFALASADCGLYGIFMQKRIGQFGKPFVIFKLETIHPKTRKISGIGAFLRKYKIDELPQFINVFIGTMSIVGPRPDVPGYFDLLQGEERKILEMKPGIICAASLKYINEEKLLSNQDDPLQYNNAVIFPDKIKMNLEYYYNRGFLVDAKIIASFFLKAIFP